MIVENLKAVKTNIDTAALKSGRNTEDITLIAVSKTKPVEMLLEAYNDGIRVFGENKVQEMVSKYEEMPKDIHWHMIGHLQRNKVKYIAPFVDLIHSVDSFRLAEEINIQAKKNNRIIPILIEINAAGEDTKFGLPLEEVKSFIKDVSELDAIKVVGLMTVAPYVVDSEENREIFHKIKALSVDIMNENIYNVSMDILSMGMTGDYMVAIEEGATHVRVGTGIFGERNYNL